MKVVKPQQEEAEVIPFTGLRLMRGGKGPPESGGINWLRGLKQGTAFSCKKKGNVDFLEIYIAAFKHEKTVILVNGLDNNHRFAIDPEDFCKKYTLFEILGEEEDKPPVEKEDDSVRTVRSGIVENDVDAE